MHSGPDRASPGQQASVGSHPVEDDARSQPRDLAQVSWWAPATRSPCQFCHTDYLLVSSSEPPEVSLRVGRLPPWRRECNDAQSICRAQIGDNGVKLGTKTLGCRSTPSYRRPVVCCVAGLHPAEGVEPRLGKEKFSRVSSAFAAGQVGKPAVQQDTILRYGESAVRGGIRCRVAESSPGCHRLVTFSF